jgi:hypothetical protein
LQALLVADLLALARAWGHFVADETGTTAPGADQGEAAPMLDVHPPTAAIHGWKDFFLHVATITIGLLIALGLEQTVEYFHNQHLLRVTREEIAVELADNLRIAKLNNAECLRLQAVLVKNIDILEVAQKSSTPNVSGLNYDWNFDRTPDGAWQTAKQSTALGLFPHDELRRYTYDYAVFASIMDTMNASTIDLETARVIAKRASNGALSPKNIDDLIAANTNAQGKYAWACELVTFELASLDHSHN